MEEAEALEALAETIKRLITMTQHEFQVEGENESNENASESPSDEEDIEMGTTLQEFIGKFMEELIIPLEQHIKDHCEPEPEYQRVKLYMKMKTKAIMSPLTHADAIEFSKTLEKERKTALEQAINKLFNCKAQKESEAIEEYGGRVQFLANECFSLISLGEDADKEAQTAHIRKMQYFIFVSGLEENVRKWVVRKMPEDFVKAVIVAMLIGWKLEEVKKRVRDLGRH